MGFQKKGENVKWYKTNKLQNLCKLLILHTYMLHKWVLSCWRCNLFQKRPRASWSETANSPLIATHRLAWSLKISFRNRLKFEVIKWGNTPTAPQKNLTRAINTADLPSVFQNPVFCEWKTTPSHALFGVVELCIVCKAMRLCSEKFSHLYCTVSAKLMSHPVARQADLSGFYGPLLTYHRLAHDLFAGA